MTDIKTGTTTVGIVAKDCVVLAADMRASMGHIPIDEESQKIYPITSHLAVTNAGNVGDSLTIIRFLRSHARLYELAREEKMTAKAAVTFLSNVLNANRYYPFIVQLIIGGVVDEPELYDISPYGGLLERKKYAVTGSGTEPALTTLDLEYKTGMTQEEATDLAIKAIESGKRRDIFSGGKSVSVTIITKQGTTTLSERDVTKKIAKTVQK
jgi:proteasome beta subunit